MRFNSIIASAIMILTALSIGSLNEAKDVPIKKPLSEFPVRVGEWSGTTGRFDPEIYEKLGVDDSILCDFRNPNGGLVNLYVGFYGSQREGDLIHSPKNCMPGAGWKITRAEIEDVLVPGPRTQKIKAVKLRLEKEGSVTIMLYWFQSRGRFIASEYGQKLYLVLDSMLKHRTDGSFVRLVAPVADGDERKALENAKNFAAMIIPILNEHLPS